MNSIALTKIVIYAYSSFVSAWGPGPKIVESFKAKCQLSSTPCEVELVDMGDTNLVIDRLSRASAKKSVDVIVGFDQLTLARAQKKLKWKDLSQLQKPNFIGSGEYKEFVAFDWAPMAFIYRTDKLSAPPMQLDDLLDPKFKNQILLQDPRLSTPGLQFLSWVYLNKGEKTREFLEKLRPQVHSVSPSWSSAYGLFTKEQAQLVFSYLSSPIYHWREDKNQNFKSIAFKENHATQTEWAGVPANCKQCDLATRFVEHLLSDESQKLLMDRNYMFPVNLKLISGTDFERLPKVQSARLADYKNVNPDELLKIWKAVFR